MRVSPVHLVSGGTGFLGATIILELLRQTQAEIMCLVRPGAVSVEERLQQALAKACQIYGYEQSMLQTAQERCRAIAGDVEDEQCAIKPAALPRLSQFWHGAASLRYEDRYVSEVARINVEGTRHALDLASRLKIEGAFNYISTAYVAGSRTGVILEEPSQPATSRNHYETSKQQAEALVSAASALQTRIFRPSIVIGHSTTHGVASGFSGLYGFVRKLVRYKAAMSRIQEGLLARETLQMCVEPDAPLNFFPVDLVARQVVQMSGSSTSASIFHVTNSTPPTVGTVLTAVLLASGLKAPRFVETREQLNWIDSKLDESITFYKTYFRETKHFDRSQSDAAPGTTSHTKLPSSVRFFVSTGVRRARLIFHDRSQLSIRGLST
jgi:thioester reductase-like protein